MRIAQQFDLFDRIIVSLLFIFFPELVVVKCFHQSFLFRIYTAIINLYIQSFNLTFLTNSNEAEICFAIPDCKKGSRKNVCSINRIYETFIYK